MRWEAPPGARPRPRERTRARGPRRRRRRSSVRSSPRDDRMLGAIFDVDGVFVDSAGGHYRAWSRLGAGRGGPTPRDVFESTFGMHNRQIIPIWLGDRARSEDID